MSDNREHQISNLKEHISILKSQISSYIDRTIPYNTFEDDPNSGRNRDQVDQFIKKVTRAKIELKQKETSCLILSDNEKMEKERQVMKINTELKRMVEREREKNKRIRKMQKNLQVYNSQSALEVEKLKKEIEHVEREIQEEKFQMSPPLQRFSAPSRYKEPPLDIEFLDPFMQDTPITIPPPAKKSVPLPMFFMDRERKFSGKDIKHSKVNFRDNRIRVKTEGSGRLLNKFKSINKFKRRGKSPMTFEPTPSGGKENQKVKRMFLNGDLEDPVFDVDDDLSW